MFEVAESWLMITKKHKLPILSNRSKKGRKYKKKYMELWTYRASRAVSLREPPFPCIPRVTCIYLANGEITNQVTFVSERRFMRKVRRVASLIYEYE